MGPSSRGAAALYTYFHNPVTYSQQNGYPLESTSVVVKDDYGFMWIGGRGGLLRFDGAAFTRIPLCVDGDEVESVRDIWLDGDRQVLWLATWGYGILQLDLETYTCSTFAGGEGHFNRHVNWLQVDTEGLWMGRG
ncbi:hypothetical protein CRP01_04010 [Flavilitoribacter nigricans DSM 23189 = NBRC 102662]|uniref:Two component regulator propeller n=1 Tax=Flavilitoribacter nigricans (strain ATCC 23147 / DSM 23189 / NBRC 102662 / NCIMB 1420 / SS-2) TaxID=1122177 RepID=A0A2D0NHN4_FLAN2|nr:hypothetical protein CRP01_04010 [Flavilitoribacter nigricans DSM 23189 = NBRC 102662]